MELQFTGKMVLEYDGSYHGHIIDAPDAFWDAVGRENGLVEQHTFTNLPTRPGIFKCVVEGWYTDAFEWLVTGDEIDIWEFIISNCEDMDDSNLAGVRK